MTTPTVATTPHTPTVQTAGTIQCFFTLTMLTILHLRLTAYKRSHSLVGGCRTYPILAGECYHRTTQFSVVADRLGLKGRQLVTDGPL